MVALAAEHLATGLAMDMTADKGGGLLLQEVLLKGFAELFRISQGQAEMPDVLARLLQDDHVGKGFFVAIVITDDELHFNLHGGFPPAAC
jgi:hypothetical protein